MAPARGAGRRCVQGAASEGRAAGFRRPEGAGRGGARCPRWDAALEALQSVDEGESLVRLVRAEALAATSDPEGAILALRAAHTPLCERATSISKPRYRVSFLQDVPENARIL